jgi:hypothetical protein
VVGEGLFHSRGEFGDTGFVDSLRRLVRHLATLARRSAEVEAEPRPTEPVRASQPAVVDTFEPAAPKVAPPPLAPRALAAAFRAESFSGFVDGFEPAARPPVDLSGGREPVVPEVYELPEPAPVVVNTGFSASLDDLVGADEPSPPDAGSGAQLDGGAGLPSAVPGTEVASLERGALSEGVAADLAQGPSVGAPEALSRTPGVDPLASSTSSVVSVDPAGEGVSGAAPKVGSAGGGDEPGLDSLGQSLAPSPSSVTSIESAGDGDGAPTSSAANVDTLGDARSRSPSSVTRVEVAGEPNSPAPGAGAAGDSSPGAAASSSGSVDGVQPSVGSSGAGLSEAALAGPIDAEKSNSSEPSPGAARTEAPTSANESTHGLDASAFAGVGEQRPAPLDEGPGAAGPGFVSAQSSASTAVEPTMPAPAEGASAPSLPRSESERLSTLPSDGSPRSELPEDLIALAEVLL